MDEVLSTPPQAFGAAEEQPLVEALRAGREEAYEQVVREYSPRLLAVIRRLLSNQDDAAEVLQETFLQAFRAIGRFEGGSKIGTWLHRIAVNAALMRLRTQRRHPERSIEDLLPSFDDSGHRMNVEPTFTITADRVAEDVEMQQVIRRSIDELPEDYRTVLVLRDLEEMDTTETAKVLGISDGAVKTRLHRARLALRELLQRKVRGESSQ